MAEFEGSITFIVNKGTLTAVIDHALPGTFNLGTDDFAAKFGVTGGTGKLQDATGMLVIEGNQGGDGSFTETVVGEICVDLSPP